MRKQHSFVRLVLSSLFSFAAAILLGCGGGHPYTGGAISISAENAAVSAGSSTQLHAIQYDLLGVSRDISATVVWTSSTPSVATVSTSGLLTGMASGSATITATFSSATGTLPVTIGSPSMTGIALSPANANIYTNGTQQYTATATYANNTTANITGATAWSVLPASVASINATTGLLTAIAPGTFVITATNGSQNKTVAGTVTNAPLSAVTITPANPSIQAGTKQQFTATATYAGGSTQNVTNLVTWESSNQSLLSIDTAGLATLTTSNTAANVTVTAQMGSVSQATTVTVTPSAKVTALIVQPTSSTIAAGTAEAHTATAMYSDGSRQDVTNAVTWSIAANTIATVDQTGMDWGLAPGTVTVQASYAGIDSQSTVIVTPATISALEITATRAFLPVGAKQKLVLTGTFSDGSHQDLSLSATWQSSDTALATIAADGTATGLAMGNIQFTATFGGLTAATTGFQVLPRDLVSTVVRVPYPIVINGITEQLNLIGIYSDGSTHDLTNLATWTSSDPGVFPVDTRGVAYGLKPGNAQVTGTAFGKSAIVSVSNSPSTLSSIQILPTPAQFALGTTTQFTALGTFGTGSLTDISYSAVWRSSDPTVFTVDTHGRAKSGKAGTATLSATLLGITQTLTVNVTSATLTRLSIAPTSATATTSSGHLFTARGFFSDGTLQDLTHDVLWNTTDATVASIDNAGLALGMKAGQVNVTATFGSTTAAAPLTITDAALLSTTITPGNTKLPLSVNRQYTLLGHFSDGTTEDLGYDAIWSAPTPSIVDVIANGEAIGISAGLGEVAAQHGYFTASTPVTVTNATLTGIAMTPATASIRRYSQQPFTTTGTFSDGFTQPLILDAVFHSSAPNVANIDSEGRAIGTGIGVSTITAAFNGQIATSSLQVKSDVLASIAVTPTNLNLTAGHTQQLTATGTYADGTTDDLTSQIAWTSSDPTVFSVDINGLATAYATTSAVNVTVTAALGTTTQTFTVTVSPATTTPNPPTLTGIILTPTAAHITNGTTHQFTLTGTYSDGTTQNLSTQAAWLTSNASVATVSTTGLVAAKGIGSVTITATVNDQTATTTAQVTAASLVSIAVTPTSSHIAAGTAQQLTLTGTYSDGSMQNLTSAATWTSSAPLTAQLSSMGVATGLSPGTATLTAQLGDMQSTAVIIVSAATLQSIALSPAGASFAAGATQQFTLTGTFTDGTTQNLSTQAAWLSSNPAVATISATGLVTGTGVGPVTITATSNGQTASTTAQITPANIVSMVISPASPSFAKGTTQQFTAMATYTDGTTHDATAAATFSSSNPSVVSITSAGLAMGMGTGGAQITATAGNQSVTTQSVTVTPATMSSITIYPNTVSIASGTTTQFVAIAVFSDNTTQDITGQVVWTSSNPQAITINASGLAQSTTIGTAQITAALNHITASTGTVTITPATLTGLSVTPASAQLAKGSTRQFAATGTYTDGTTQDLSTQVTWTSATPTVASIDTNGLATGNTNGTTQIGASFQGKSANASSLTVTNAVLLLLTFNPSAPSVAAGTSTQVSVLGHYSDNTTQDLTASATFASANPAAATVSNTGLVTGIAPGLTLITVTANGSIAAFPVTVTNATLVSIAITPATPPSFAKGTTQQFTAMGTYTDGTTQNLSTQAAWSSSDNNVVTINHNGLATGTGVGSASLTATLAGKTVTTAAFQVTPATTATITILPANQTLTSGATVQFTATANYTDGTTQDVTAAVTWNSSNTNVALISSGGLALAEIPGTTSITASNGSMTGTTTLSTTLAPILLTAVTVAPPNSTLAVATAQQYIATAHYSDGSTQDVTTSAIWSSTVPTAALVSATGLVTCITAGNTTIAARFDLITGSTNLTVTAANATLTSIAVTPANTSIAAGATQQYAAIATYSDGTTQNVTGSVTWTSSSLSNAIILPNGLATGILAGSTTIAAHRNGITSGTTLTITAPAISSIAITPGLANIAKGNTQQFTATAILTDGTTQNVTNTVTWQSSLPVFATINSNGLATGVNGGLTQIWATLSGKTAMVTLTVSPAALVSLTVTPSTTSLANGTSQQYKATGTMTDGATQDFTLSVLWSSSNASIASIDLLGNATAHSLGNATITATAGSISANATLAVTAATPVSVQLTPAVILLPAGGTQQLLATATFSDGTSQNVTTSVTYASSSSTVAAVDANGKLTAAGAGTSTITATLGSISTTALATITTATLSSIAVTPTNPNLAAGESQQLIATGTYTDGSTQDLTHSVLWASSDPLLAAVSLTGNATAVTHGTTTINASFLLVNGSTTITVTGATVTAVAITPAIATVAAGQTKQFTATATLSDLSQQDVTHSASWSVSDASKATITGNGGFLSTTAPGLVTVNATLNGISGASVVTVQPSILLSLTITPSTLLLAAGTTQQLTVTGHYSDGSTSDLTASATYLSLNSSAAAVNASGLIHAVATGTALISVSVGLVTQTVTTTVTNAVLSAIAITPGAPSMPAGVQAQLTATGTYSDGSTQDITSRVQWTSSSPAAATVGTTGLVSSLAVGSITITATLSGVTQTAPITVTAATLQSIAVTASQSSFALGLSLQLSATGTYSDGSTRDLTGTTAWSSQSPAIGMVNASGLATGVTMGTFNARATTNGISGALSVTVLNAVLQSIVVTPSNAVIVNILGAQLQYTATGHFSDGSTQNITTTAHWAITSGLGLGSISSTGKFTATAVGLGTIAATSGTITGSTGFVVVSAL